MIIIADDDKLYDKDLKTILELEEYKDIRAVTTCKELFDMMATNGAPETLILDMMIPWDGRDFIGGTPPDDAKDLRGLRVVEELEKTDFDLRRIVVITAFYSQTANELLHRFGVPVRNILLKPARTKEILLLVRAACNIRESE